MLLMGWALKEILTGYAGRREGVRRRTKNMVSLLYFMMSKFQVIGKNESYIRSSIMCAYNGRGFIMIVVRTHVGYPFPIVNENVFYSQYYIHFNVLSEFWDFTHNERNCPILDNYQVERIGISLYSSCFLLKGPA